MSAPNGYPGYNPNAPLSVEHVRVFDGFVLALRDQQLIDNAELAQEASAGRASNGTRHNNPMLRLSFFTKGDYRLGVSIRAGEVNAWMAAQQPQDREPMPVVRDGIVLTLINDRTASASVWNIQLGYDGTHRCNRQIFTIAPNPSTFYGVTNAVLGVAGLHNGAPAFTNPFDEAAKITDLITNGRPDTTAAARLSELERSGQVSIWTGMKPIMEGSAPWFAAAMQAASEAPALEGFFREAQALDKMVSSMLTQEFDQP